MAKSTRIETTPLRLVPLAELSLSPLNSRQQVPQAEVLAMADSISTVGLLQNLVAHETPDGRLEIVGGGIRMRALQLLAAQGFVAAPGAAIDPVPVKVTTDADLAVAWSGTENSARQSLTPADAVCSFAALAAKGQSVQLIARTFAVSESHVKRHLALANLPALAIDALRDGQITLEQAKALTLAETNARALEMLETIRGRDVPVWTIRNELTSGRIEASDFRAVFVGLEAYVSAGGTVSADLFSDSAYLHDAGLLDQMTDQVGRALAETVLAEGWKWADFRPKWQSCEGLKSATQLQKEPGGLPEGDQDRYDELEELEDGHVLDAAGAAELAALRARFWGGWTDDQRATSGVVVYLGQKGAEFSRGWQRHADRPAQVETETHADGTVTQRSLPAADQGQSQSLTDDLNRIRLRALQTAVLGDPQLAITLLGWMLTTNLKPWDAPLAVSVTAQNVTPEKPDGSTIDTRLVPPSRPMVAATVADFAAYEATTWQSRLDQMGVALCATIKSAHGDLAEHLGQRLRPDTRAIWTPTASGYLGRIAVHQLDALWCQLVTDTADHPDFLALKKSAKAARLESLFNDLSVRETLGLSRTQNAVIDAWLPPELQWAAPDAPEVPEFLHSVEAAE